MHKGNVVFSIQRLRFVTARKRSLGQGNVFTRVCHFLHGEGGLHPGGGMHPGGGICIQEGGSASRGVCLQGVCIQAGLDRPPPSIRYYRIQSTSGRYAFYWNAFLLIYATAFKITLKFNYCLLYFSCIPDRCDGY